MTDDELHFQKENLAFFKSMWLDPGIKGVTFAHDRKATPFAHWVTSTPIMNAIGLIESTLWLQLGTEIGFFDKDSVLQELGTIEDGLVLAWRTIKDKGSLSLHSWCDFISEGPEPTLMKEKIISPPEQPYTPLDHLDDSHNLEYLRQCFWGCLLLTSEIIFEPSTMFFLENIGWEGDEKWKDLIRGKPMSNDFSSLAASQSAAGLEDLYVGFANHVQYLEQLPLCIVNYLEADIDYQVLRNNMSTLVNRVLTIVSRRWIVDRKPANERLFELGGKVLTFAYQQGPEWELARISVFYQIGAYTRTWIDSSPSLWFKFVGDSEENVGRAMQEPHGDSRSAAPDG